MAIPQYQEHSVVSLKNHVELNEKWVQRLLGDRPALLGLGDVDVKDMERRQPHAGRLDMLLSDRLTKTRYEVELQLGDTNETHIIRTIEYWDVERRRYPQYEHIAVIVAERITARFFNVISLFNGYIPITAIQMRAIELNGAMTLIFTTVLEPIQLGTEEEEEASEPTDRKYWEGRANKAMLSLTDSLLELIHEVAADMSLNYNKHYIGLIRDGVAANFITFTPRKQKVICELRLPLSDDVSQRLEDEGMDMLTYDAEWKRYRLRIDREDVEGRADVLRDLIRAAYNHYAA